VYLQAVRGTPGTNVGQRPLAALAERGFRGENDALRRRHPDETLDEVLPGGVARLWRKWQVAPEVNTRPRHPELKLACIEELEGGCASHQQVGVWGEADMHALEPRRPGKSFSSGEQAHMATVQPVKDPKRQH
jgi:hypothetical protein